jgi:ribosomal protein S18 acetylase RimI-like enzyme
MDTKIVMPPRRFYLGGMEPGVTIRTATQADAEGLAALVRRCFAELVVVPAPSALGESAASVAAQIASGGGAVAEGAGMLVAGVLWAEKEGGLYLGRLAVAPECRLQGLARALIAAAEQEAQRLGLPRLHLGTRLSLTGNRALFARCGFVECGRFFHPGFAEPTWVALEKRLG